MPNPITTPPADLWSALEALLGALAATYRADFRAALAAAGLSQQPVGVLLHAGDIAPRPLTTAGLLACVPYYAPAAFTTRLEKLAAGGWLERGPDGYALTALGRAATEGMYSAVRARLASLRPLPAADLARLAALLDALVAAGVAPGRLTDRACAAASGTLGPNPESALLARAAWSVEALTNQRCDAHRAAWQPLGVSGPAWETLTWLWEGRADSVAGLYAWANAQPFPRGFSAQAYNGFVTQLVQAGWANLDAAGAATITQAGRAARAAAEADTEALFFGPWSVVSPTDLAELHHRAQSVTAALQD